MKFYEELNDILGTRPATRPRVLIDSSAQGVTEPTEGQDAGDGAMPATADNEDNNAEKESSTLPEVPPSGKEAEGAGIAKQAVSGKKRLREELFEKAMDTAMKKLAAANEESDKKYFELEEKRLKLEERAIEQQLQQRQEFQQMVL